MWREGKIMKKKNLLINIGKIIFTYAILLIFSNADFFAKKVFFNGKCNFDFINLSILISILVLSLCIIFEKYLFKRKIYFWIMFGTIIIYNFSEAFFNDFVVYPFLILYIYFLILSFFIMMNGVKRFEIALPISFSSIIIMAFIFGLFNILPLFKYFLILLLIFIIVFYIKQYKKNHEIFKTTLNNFFDSGFIIFSILWILALFLGAGLYVHSWDEYSHWAYDAKAVIYYSKFGASQDIMLKSKNYPPIFTVWHYIISIFTKFNEHNLYVGLNMLIMVYLLPIFYYIKNNNIITKIFIFIASVFSICVFGGVYGYFSLYADAAISIIFASTLFVYYLLKNEHFNKGYDKLLFLLYIILTLSKPNGFVISGISLIIIFLDEMFSCSIKSVGTLTKKTSDFIKKYKLIIFSVFITLIIWKFYLFFMSKITTDYYDFTLLPDSLRGNLNLKLDYSYILNFCKRVFYSLDSSFISGPINLTLYQFLIINFSIIFILIYKIEGNIKKSLRKFLPILLGYISFFIITVISVFYALSVYEASILASFSRYLNWFNVILPLIIIFLISKINNSNLVLKNIILTFILLYIPLSSMFKVIINPLKNDSLNVSYARNEKVRIVNENTEPDSFVYVIDQQEEDGIMAMWYSRYYCFPRKTNATGAVIGWKIKTKKNKDDLGDWGFTAEAWAKHLKKYKFDYVFLYSKDDEFFNETEFLYDDVDTAKKATLFKIINNDDSIKLIPIK